MEGEEALLGGLITWVDSREMQVLARSRHRTQCSRQGYWQVLYPRASTLSISRGGN